MNYRQQDHWPLLMSDSGCFQTFFILETEYDFFQGIQFFPDEVKSFLMKKCIKYTERAAS